MFLTIQRILFTPKNLYFLSSSCCALMLFEHSAYSRIIISNYQLLSITENESPETLDCGGFERCASPAQKDFSPVRNAISPARDAISPARDTISPVQKDLPLKLCGFLWVISNRQAVRTHLIFKQLRSDIFAFNGSSADIH